MLFRFGFGDCPDRARCTLSSSFIFQYHSKKHSSIITYYVVPDDNMWTCSDVNRKAHITTRITTGRHHNAETKTTPFTTIINSCLLDRPYNNIATDQSAGRIRVGRRTYQYQNAAVISPAKYEFFVPVWGLQTLKWLYCYRQLTISVVGSAIAVFTQFDNSMPNRLRFVHWPNYKFKPLANSNRDTGLSGHERSEFFQYHFINVQNAAASH